MPRDKTLTHAKIIQCMREEFLKYGYERASLNRISADSACPCPPGVPVVMPGEIIDENSISLLGKNTFIRVVKGAF